MAVKALACAGLLFLCACQGTTPTYGFQPVAGQPAIPSGEADATCLGRAAAAKRAAAADIWAQGGEPAYHQTYAACMASFGWKRIVVSSYRYG
ncbi:MAG: hypothetical protein Q8R85_11295 [Bosea sp. (in: a-proteobacteria)]|uniref:hypothetical protein n=1 Tax=Bosea sp. (in: a-proteobacteria) TaxID=1871050 RepID=UPI0027343B8F|nr:hypothetical protein [Bosea sp. (in: a-proteobacteria)]MDP3601737.1 hypothetical protein [Bosea sp. (in: a-proteobacteria)]